MKKLAMASSPLVLKKLAAVAEGLIVSCHLLGSYLCHHGGLG